MNKDQIKGKWKQIKGEVKIQWGRLTDDELDQIEGNFDKMVGKLQEHYGYSKEHAANEANSFLKKYE